MGMTVPILPEEYGLESADLSQRLGHHLAGFLQYVK